MAPDHPTRHAFDVDAYQRRTRTGPCFICQLIAHHAGYEHEIVEEDDRHVAFLSRYPTVVGYTIVAPKPHVEHAVRDLTLPAYLDLMAAVRRVALAVEAVVPCERTYLLTLGSQQGNAHLHWHIAPLPPGIPYADQQFHALMLEHGVLDWSAEQAAALGTRIREQLAIARKAAAPDAAP